MKNNRHKIWPFMALSDPKKNTKPKFKAVINKLCATLKDDSANFKLTDKK